MSHSDRRAHTTITIDHSAGNSSHSLTDDEDYSHGSREYSSSQADLEDPWADEYDDDDEIDPEDSASASAAYPPRVHSRPNSRQAPRRHRLSHHAQPFPYRPAPNPPPMQTVSNEGSDEYNPFAGGPRGPYAPPPPPGSYYPGRGGPAPAYPQSHVGGPGYAPPPPPPPFAGGQMVPYDYRNPFSPMAGAGGAAYFGERAPGPYDMMPYQQGPPPAHYFPGGGPGYGLPPHLQQFMYSQPPPPPPTEAPAPAPPATPAPPAEKKPDPELEMMKTQLELFKAEKAKKEEEERHKQLEEKIRKDAEEAFHRRMEAMQRAQEEAKKEIEKARAEAERAARERIEAERKAEEERQKLHAEAMARAEREARDKIEAERKADEERRKREAEAAALAEAAARAKIEAAMRAEEEAKALAAKKAAEEAEWKKRLEEEAKLKAEIDARQKIEAEKKAAEDAAAAEAAKKAEEDAFKKRALEEAKVKAEEAAKSKEKAPIKFKDAVGRKFSFPYHLCQTWQGMEELIKQAFVHVDVIGPHVQEGHYDLIGPNGEIILPSVWEKVVEPDWAITMHMWPMDKTPPLRGQMPPGMPPHAMHGMPQQRVHGHHGGLPPRGMPFPIPPGGFPPGMRPPMGRGPQGGHPPMPPNWQGPMPGARPEHRMPAGVNIVEVEKPRKKSTKTKDPFLSFLGGAQKKKSSSKKK